jgi:hypothetical protein
MNELNVSLQHSILTLAANGWSHRRIARELAIHRETVGRHLRLAGSKPAKVLTGSASDPAAKPAIALTGCLTAGRQSLCVPLQTVIESAVQAGLSAQRIYQDLICEHAFTGGYHSVQRFVRQLLQTQPVPFVRMEVEPGQEAQVDFGQGAWVLVDGKRKRPHLFRIVLSHSRKGYSEVVWQQTTESFIRCLENAFRYFCGVPRTLIIDNLRAAVSHRMNRWNSPPTMMKKSMQHGIRNVTARELNQKLVRMVRSTRNYRLGASPWFFLHRRSRWVQDTSRAGSLTTQIAFHFIMSDIKNRRWFDNSFRRKIIPSSFTRVNSLDF